MKAEDRIITHFTKEFKNLKGILSSGFKLKFCREEIVFRGEKRALRVPMVSFCDIPIHQAEENKSKYGNYAIALTEDWAIIKGLTPVIYLQSDSFLADSLLNVINFITGESTRNSIKKILARLKAKGLEPTPKNFANEIISETSNSNDDSLMASLDILRYTKNYVGELKRTNGDFDPHYYFSNEREWRYALNTPNFGKFIYPDEAFKDDGIATIAKSLIADEKLEFTSKDVRYILVENRDECSELKDYIQNISAQFRDTQIADLCEKILTFDQLQELETTS